MSRSSQRCMRAGSVRWAPAPQMGGSARSADAFNPHPSAADAPDVGEDPLAVVASILTIGGLRTRGAIAGTECDARRPRAVTVCGHLRTDCPELVGIRRPRNSCLTQHQRAVVVRGDERAPRSSRQSSWLGRPNKGNQRLVSRNALMPLIRPLATSITCSAQGS